MGLVSEITKLKMKKPAKAGGKNFSRFLLIAILLLFCLGLIYYFALVLKVSVVYTHLFYIPIVLAAIWWGLRGGLSVSLILGLFYLLSQLPGLDLSAGLRSLIFIFVGAVVGLIRDSQLKAEESLKESEERYRRFFHTSKDCVFITDKTGKIIEVNEAGVKLFGYQDKNEFLQVKVQDLYVHPEDRQQFLAGIEKYGFSENWETEMRKKDGSIFSGLISAVGIKDETGKIFRYQGILRDLSPLKELERQLLHSQKMEALGNLAGGMAHNFNNLLAAIVINLARIRKKLPAEHPAQEIINTIEETGKRASEMLRQLLMLGRPMVTQARVICLNEMVEEAIRLLGAAIPADIKLEKKFSSESCRIKADPSMINQLITNLSINARDAMPEGGILSFATEIVKVEEAYRKSRLEAAPGEYCLLTVSDTGSGIPLELQQKIFEPFFTTKEKSKGSGLGLSMVYGAVKQMGGWLELDSKVGKGSSFKIFLPRVTETG